MSNDVLEIVEKLANDFSLEHLEDFIEEKFTKFDSDKKRRFFNCEDEERFLEVQQIGDVDLSDKTRFCVFAIKHKGEITERTSKKKQFELAKRILEDAKYDAGFFVFYDESKNFRFSLVYSIAKGT